MDNQTPSRKGRRPVTDNPLCLERERLGIKRRDLAAAAGVSCTRLSQIENGEAAQIPAHWRIGFERLGLDFDALNEAHKAWRAARVEAIIKAAAQTEASI